MIVAILITLLLGFITYCLIILNQHKEELWDEIYKRMR